MYSFSSSRNVCGRPGSPVAASRGAGHARPPRPYPPSGAWREPGRERRVAKRTQAATPRGGAAKRTQAATAWGGAAKRTQAATAWGGAAKRARAAMPRGGAAKRTQAATARGGAAKRARATTARGGAAKRARATTARGAAAQRTQEVVDVEEFWCGACFGRRAARAALATAAGVCDRPGGAWRAVSARPAQDRLWIRRMIRSRGSCEQEGARSGARRPSPRPLHRRRRWCMSAGQRPAPPDGRWPAAGQG
jgi:hypothetical protein